MSGNNIRTNLCVFPASSLISERSTLIGPLTYNKIFSRDFNERRPEQLWQNTRQSWLITSIVIEATVQESMSGNKNGGYFALIAHSKMSLCQFEEPSISLLFIYPLTLLQSTMILRWRYGKKNLSMILVYNILIILCNVLCYWTDRKRIMGALS